MIHSTWTSIYSSLYVRYYKKYRIQGHAINSVLSRVASGQGKVSEKNSFSRSVKSHWILWEVSEKVDLHKSQWKVSEFETALVLFKATGFTQHWSCPLGYYNSYHIQYHRIHSALILSIGMLQQLAHSVPQDSFSIDPVYWYITTAITFNVVWLIQHWSCLLGCYNSYHIQCRVINSALILSIGMLQHISPELFVVPPSTWIFEMVPGSYLGLLPWCHKLLKPQVEDPAGPRLNIKTVLSTYGDFHVKDKTAVRTSYL